MTKQFVGFLAVAALAVSVAAPLSAQSVRVIANIPFEFSVGNSTLPAGEYTVLPASTPYVIRIRNEETNAGLLTATNGLMSMVHSQASAARLIFNRYGDHYVLSQIWGGYGSGVELPKSRTERELAKTASTNRVEILAMLAAR